MRRRRLITVILALGLTMVLGACSADDSRDVSTAPVPTDAILDSTGPIKIGMLTSLTGPFAQWGVSVRDGMRLAADEINAGGGVGGRQIQLIEYDTQSNPEEGVIGFERMVEQGVVAAAGVISSDVALSTTRIAEELHVPLFLVKAGADAVLTQDSRYTFRTCLVAASMVAGPLAEYIEAEGIAKVGAIVADYAWGQSIKSALEAAFADDPDVELLIEVAPVSEKDFSPYLRKLQDFDAEILVASGHPPGGVSITKQSADFGMKIPVVGSWNAIAPIMNAVGEQAINRYADFACIDYDSPEYQDLARRYLAMSDNPFMESDAVAGFGIVHAIAEAVGAVGSDPNAVAKYMHENSFDIPGYSFPLSWTAWGEIAEAQPTFTMVREMTPPEGVNPGANWYPELLIKSAPLEPYVP